MKRLSSKEIKKVLFGIILTDGSINKNRFDLFTKSKEYACYVNDVLNQISGVKSTCYLKTDKRKNSYWGYRIFTNSHVYFTKLYDIFYKDRKTVNKYIVNRLDLESFAHAYICNGSLEHNINKKYGNIENIAYIHTLNYPKNEVQLISDRLEFIGINNRLYTKPSMHGYKYIIKISGLALQNFISSIYQYIPNDYKYKTILYFKTYKHVDTSLPNTEQFIRLFDKPEDIVRHSWQQEIPNGSSIRSK